MKYHLSFNQIITFILSIALLIVTIFTSIASFYLTEQNNALSKENNYLQNLQYNFRPFIYSNYSQYNLLNTSYWAPNSPFNTPATFVGIIPIDLIVISPFDGLLTINNSNLVCSYSEESYVGSKYIDMNYVNSSQIRLLSSNPNGYQYFITRGQAVHIIDNLTVQVEMKMLSNTWNWYITYELFPIGNLNFNTSLQLFQNNSIQYDNFSAGVMIKLFPIV